MGKDPTPGRRNHGSRTRWQGLGALCGLLLLALGGCSAPRPLPPVATSEPVVLGPGSVPLLLGVGLAERETSLTLTCTGPCVILDGDSGRLLARSAGSGSTLICRRAGAQVSWEIEHAAGRAGSVVMQPVDPQHLVNRDGELYRGEFLVLPTPGQAEGVTLVNNVELEAYLRGVVPWEIGRHGSDRLAALEAQAVAARTYTVAHLDARRDRGFDVFSDVMDQVYRGAAQEDSLCNLAINRTRGKILRWRGKEISAYYSACCGGVTAQLEEVWALPPQPYLISHPDTPGRGARAHCADSRHFQWTQEWTAARLTEILQETLPAYLEWAADPVRREWAGAVFRARDDRADPRKPGRLMDLKIKERTVSGRVARLEIVMAAGVYTVRGDRVRWVLRPADGRPAILRSARFELSLDRRDGALTGIAASGRGYGHGIGLCQTGALEMARLGRSVEEILAHYYPGARLVRMR